MSEEEFCAEIDLPAAAEEVWAVIMDPHRLEDWVSTHAGLVGDAPDRLDKGETFCQRLRLGKARFKVLWTVASCDRPAEVQWEGKGPGRSRAFVTYELEEKDGTTRFTYANRFELPGGALGRLAGRAFSRRIAAREADRTLENLRQLLNGQPGGESPAAD